MASLGREGRSPLDRPAAPKASVLRNGDFPWAADRYVTSSVDFDRRTQSGQRGNRFERAL